MIKLNTSQTTGIVTGALFALLTIVSGSALAQSAADNIRPVAEVCMAGQACVGQPASSGSMASSAPSGSSSSTSSDSSSNTNTASSAAPAEEEPASAPATQADSAPATEVAAASSDFDPQAVYNQNCMACHMTGAAGAPKLDDDAAWEERLAKGMDAVMTNVYNGIGAMPARGLCMSCSDEDLRAVVDYMVSQ